MVSRLQAVAGVVALIVTSACAGGSATAPSSPASAPKSAEPPNATVQARLNQVLSNFVSALNKANSHKSSVAPASPTAPRLVVAAWSDPRGVTCNANGSQCQIFEQWDTREACAAGGSLNNTGTMSGVITATTNSASGTINWTSYQSFASCSQDGWVTNSDPYFGMGGSIKVSTFGNATRQTMSFTMSGGFVMTNAPGTPNGRVSCYNSGVLLQYDDLTGWSNSGTLSCSNGVTFKY